MSNEKTKDIHNKKSRHFHDVLATYFWKKADPYANRTWLSKGPRPILCLEFHLELAGRLEELNKIQNDPLFPPVKFHIKWMSEKLLNGWRFGIRNNSLKMHPCLIPYVELYACDKEKARRFVAEQM
ncbi:MAG: RyR domain-containing protein [bacterium]